MIDRPHNPLAHRRTNRAHGVTKQDAELMRQFEYQKANAPAVVSDAKVYIEYPCRCSKWPFGHYHG